MPEPGRGTALVSEERVATSSWVIACALRERRSSLSRTLCLSSLAGHSKASAMPAATKRARTPESTESRTGLRILRFDADGIVAAEKGRGRVLGGGATCGGSALPTGTGEVGRCGGGAAA